MSTVAIKELVQLLNTKLCESLVITESEGPYGFNSNRDTIQTLDTFKQLAVLTDI